MAINIFWIWIWMWIGGFVCPHLQKVRNGKCWFLSETLIHTCPFYQFSTPKRWRQAVGALCHRRKRAVYYINILIWWIFLFVTVPSGDFTWMASLLKSKLHHCWIFVLRNHRQPMLSLHKWTSNAERAFLPWLHKYNGHSVSALLIVITVINEKSSHIQILIDQRPLIWQSQPFLHTSID